MERKVTEIFRKWRKNHNQALLVSGARQIGKTYSILEFAKEYDSYVYLNLEDEPELKEIFERSRNPDDIFLSISLSKGFSIPDNTRPLIIIDEIQCCGEAYSALKPLVDDGTLFGNSFWLLGL